MLWTLILSMTVVSTDRASTHSIAIQNLPSKEVCQDAGKQHVEKYQNRKISSRGYPVSSVAVYTCVEQGKVNGL